jgi:hypothetical protein
MVADLPGLENALTRIARRGIAAVQNQHTF